MDSNLVPDPELTALEARIAAWKPSSGGLDHDRLLFEAGRASAGSSRGWRTATGCLILTLAALGSLMVRERHRFIQHTQALQTELTAARSESLQKMAPREAVAMADLAVDLTVARASYLDLTRRLASGETLDAIDRPDQPTPSILAPDPGRPLRARDSDRLRDL
jgi:hypothetical protein